jgi:hypothetical protein
MNHTFNGVSLVWSILRKHVPESITNEIKGMRAFLDMTGTVFDVPEDMAQRFEDIFSHLKSENRIEFDVYRAKSLPELREDDRP